MVKVIALLATAITMWIFPSTQIAGEYGRVQKTVLIRIVKHTDNRAVTLAWGSDIGESGSRFFQIDGENSWASMTTYITLTKGTYLIESCLHKTNRRKDCVQQWLEVL